MFPFPALLTSFFFAFVSADYFTNPASFTTGPGGTNTQTQDLTYTFQLGQQVQITWFSPALDDVYVSLTISYWDQGSSGNVLAALMSKVFQYSTAVFSNCLYHAIANAQAQQQMRSITDTTHGRSGTAITLTKPY